MRHTTKKALISAAVLIGIGLILFATVMTVYGWDFTKLNTVKFQTKTHEIGDPFNNISIDTDTADVRFAVSDDGQCRVVCEEQKNIPHAVTVQNGALTVCVKDNRKWHEYIAVCLQKTKITVFLPEANFGTLTVKNSTGNITVPKDFRFDNIDISVSTGDVTLSASAENRVKITAGTGTVTLSSVTCKNILSSGSTGNILLKNTIAAESISIIRNTGNVTFDGSDGGKITVTTNTGDVTGSLLSTKVFTAKSDTGHIDVPHSSTGGSCTVTTDTGDIILRSPD